MTPDDEVVLLRQEVEALRAELAEIKSRAQAPIPAALAAAVTISRDIVARQAKDVPVGTALALADAVVKFYGLVGATKWEAEVWRNELSKCEEQRDLRDSWLVEKGLWMEFVASLPGRDRK